MHPTIAKRDTGTGVLAANGLNLGISTELIQDGVLRIDFRDGAVQISAGEMFVVPKGVEHKPYAEHEVKLLLIEPRGVPNTGDQGGDRTAPNDVWMRRNVFRSSLPAYSDMTPSGRRAWIREGPVVGF